MKKKMIGAALTVATTISLSAGASAASRDSLTDVPNSEREKDCETINGKVVCTEVEVITVKTGK